MLSRAERKPQRAGPMQAAVRLCGLHTAQNPGEVDGAEVHHSSAHQALFLGVPRGGGSSFEISV